MKQIAFATLSESIMLEIPEKLLEILGVLKPFKKTQIRQNTIGLIQKIVKMRFFFDTTTCITIHPLTPKSMKH